MKIIVVADVLNGLYNNGVIRSSKKLDRRDFLQMCKAAKGSVLRKFYFDEKQRSESIYHFLTANSKPGEYKVIKDARGRKTVEFDYDNDKILRMPDGDGILRMTAIDAEGKINYNRNFTKAPAGSEHLYCTTEFLEDTGAMIYIAYADQIRVFGDDSVSMVEMVAILDNDDIDITEDVVWEIINYVLLVVLRVIDKPVDMRDDSSPVVQAMNSKISSPQTL
jgi:hypothetical protein